MNRKKLRLIAVGLFGVILFTACIQRYTKNMDSIDDIKAVSESEMVVNDIDSIVIEDLGTVNNTENALNMDTESNLSVEIGSADVENNSQASSESTTADDAHDADMFAGNITGSKDKTPAPSSPDKNNDTVAKPGTTNDRKPSSSSTGSTASGESSASKPDNGPSENKQPAPNQTEKPVIKEEPVPSVKPTEPEKPVHAHAYSSSITTKATCTSEGVKTFTCSCGDSYTEKITKTDHVWGAHTTKVWVVDQPAYSEPVKTVYGGYKCNSCGAKYTKEECEAGALIAHQKETDHSGTSSWSDFKITTVRHEEVGHYEEHTTYSCSVCGITK